MDTATDDYDAEKNKAIDAKKKAYYRKREDNRLRNAEKSRAGRNIAPVPSVADPARRAAAEASLKVFCETYLREASGTNKSVFNLEWSEDQLRVIKKIESAVIEGGLRSVCMPRASGKTRICVAGILWSVLTGRCKSVLLVAATNIMARRIFAEYIKPELLNNRLLLADWPEAVYPLWRLERNVNRINGQHIDDVPTSIKLTTGGITLPTVSGSQCSGSSITCAGITSGEIRGGRYDLVLCDDPQTRQSSTSKIKTEERELILMGDILALAFPGRKLSCLTTVTIIRPGDLADRLTDPSVRPEFFGERMKMVYAFPEAMDTLWEQYREIQVARLQAGNLKPIENDFYIEHREDMDRGAKVAWPARYEPNELSGIQHAMNLMYRDPVAFASEYQNEPLEAITSAVVSLTTADLAGKIEKRKRGICPNDAAYLCCKVDCHDEVLYWSVCYFGPTCCGLLDYGTFPEQNKSYFTLSNVKSTLSSKYTGDKQAILLAGLTDCLNDLMSREWKRADNSVMRIRRCHVDQGYLTGVVHQAIRNCKYSALVMPERGVPVTAKNIPFSEYKRFPHDRVFLDARIPGKCGVRELRRVDVDVNSWKTRLYNSIGVPLGGKNSFTFPTAKDKHRLLFDHILSEKPNETEGRGRKLLEWEKQPSRDNHWFDCLVGCFVAAQIESGFGSVNMPTPRRAKTIVGRGSARKRVAQMPETATATGPAAPLVPPIPATPTLTPSRVRRRSCRDW